MFRSSRLFPFLKGHSVIFLKNESQIEAESKQYCITNVYTPHRVSASGGWWEEVQEDGLIVVAGMD